MRWDEFAAACPELAELGEMRPALRPGLEPSAGLRLSEIPYD